MTNELQTIKVNEKEIPVIDSREVAEMMNKEHYLLIREIEGSKTGKRVGIIPTLENANLAVSDFFIESSYKVEGNNKTYKCYHRKDIVLNTATLNKVAAELNIPINKIENPIVYSPYRRVNAYPRKVWEKAYPDLKLPDKKCK